MDALFQHPNQSHKSKVHLSSSALSPIRLSDLEWVSFRSHKQIESDQTKVRS